MKMKGSERMKHCGRLFILAFAFTLLLGMSAFAKDRTVKMKASNGSYTYSGEYKGERFIYHRFKVGASGVMRVTGIEITKKNKRNGFSICLCDSKKKRIDVNKVNYVNGTSKKQVIKYYTLPKGTYYFRVKGASISKKSRYVLQAKFTKIPNDGGTSKAGATQLAKGSTYNVLIGAGEPDTTCSWFSFYSDEEEPIRIGFYPQLPKSNQGGFRVLISGPAYEETWKELNVTEKGDVYTFSTTVLTKRGATTTKKTKGPKKGTYYIAIMREQTDQNLIDRMNGYMKITREEIKKEEDTENN